MSKHKKFGVWMDSIHATVVGNNDEDELVIVAHIKGEKATHNSSEKMSAESLLKYFSDKI